MHTNRLKHLSLADRLEIQDLIVGYAALLDLRKFGELADLFDASGVLELPGTHLQGVAQIRTCFEAESAQSWHRDRLHHVDSIWIDCRDWDCIARSHYFETGWNPTRGECTLLTNGVFEDLIIHGTDGWKFSRRKFSPANPLPAS
jgi:hypothetical protein